MWHGDRSMDADGQPILAEQRSGSMDPRTGVMDHIDIRDRCADRSTARRQFVSKVRPQEVLALAGSSNDIWMDRLYAVREQRESCFVFMLKF